MKSQKLAEYDPNDVGKRNGKLYGLPFDYAESQVVILPVPWEVTVSYLGGTANGPEGVLNASPQIDLYDSDRPDGWQAGIFMLPIKEEWKDRSSLHRKKAAVCIDFLERGAADDNAMIRLMTDEINAGCEWLNQQVQAEAQQLLADGKIVGLLGGDHSTPLGYMQALAQRHPEGYGILQIDAHADLRESYEGFRYSHASIMYNALKIPQISKLVQVGIRDWCQAEAQLVADSQGRVVTHEMRALRRQQFGGTSWHAVCEGIVAQLPQNVYISFDIDGLDPSLCPGTGTPVPDGLGYEETCYLLDQVVQSGRRIVGFDLCEVSPQTEWDAIVGTRVLYRLSLLAAASQGR